MKKRRLPRRGDRSITFTMFDPNAPTSWVGGPVTRQISLARALSISEIEHTDIIILSASGLDLQDWFSSPAPLLVSLDAAQLSFSGQVPGVTIEQLVGMFNWEPHHTTALDDIAAV
jgi:hypothetical protein